MTWLTPQLGLIAAGIAIPSLLILYFLKLRRRDVEISTTMLWKKAIEDLQANAPFQRLRRNILLLLQLLALGAILAGLAQPEMKTGVSPGQRSVILIDRSASMSTTDGAGAGGGGPVSRLEQSKREAIRFVEGLRDPGVFSSQLLGGGQRDEAMVIAFDAGAEVAQAFTTDKARLRAAIESIQPSDAPTRMEEAARLAGAYATPVLVENRGLVAQPGAPIYLWSDGRVADADRVKVSAETQVTFRSVGGAATANTGVTAFRAERSFESPERVSVFVGLESTERAAHRVDVEFAVNGLVAAIKAVSLPAAAGPDPAAGGDAAGTGRPATGGVVFELSRQEGAIMRARLLNNDALDADNVAWLVLPPARRLAVLYVAQSPTFLRDAMEAQDLSRLLVATPDQYKGLVADGKDADFDVVVLDGWAPEGELPPGRYLVFGAVPRLEGVRATPRAPGEGAPKGRVIVDWSREHPALRSVSLENLYIARPIPLDVGKDVTVLAQSDKGPAIVEAVQGGVRAILVGFDVMESNWVWDHNMVLFVGSSLRWLGGQGVGGAQTGVQPGGTLSTRLPADARDVRITLPDGATATLAPAPDGRVTYGPIRRAGLYRVEWTGGAGPDDATVGDRRQRIIAANLLDAAESDVDAVTQIELASRPVAAATGGAGPAQTTRRLWPWLLLSALAVVMLEWFVYNRKVHV